MAKKLIDKSIPRFLMVGVLNTLVGAGVMFLLFSLGGELRGGRCAELLPQQALYLSE